MSGNKYRFAADFNLFALGWCGALAFANAFEGGWLAASICLALAAANWAMFRSNAALSKAESPSKE